MQTLLELSWIVRCPDFRVKFYCVRVKQRVMIILDGVPQLGVLLWRIWSTIFLCIFYVWFRWWDSEEWRRHIALTHLALLWAACLALVRMTHVEMSPQSSLLKKKYCLLGVWRKDMTCMIQGTLTSFPDHLLLRYQPPLPQPLHNVSHSYGISCSHNIFHLTPKSAFTSVWPVKPPYEGSPQVKAKDGFSTCSHQWWVLGNTERERS